MPPRRETATAAPRLSLRIELPGGARIGPGKVRLLEEIRARGSISAAGRALRMSYRRAWELADELSRQLGQPVVQAAPGGAGGGGARLTPLGEAVIARYRAIEAATMAGAAPHLAALMAAAPEG